MYLYYISFGTQVSRVLINKQKNPNFKGVKHGRHKSHGQTL